MSTRERLAEFLKRLGKGQKVQKIKALNSGIGNIGAMHGDIHNDNGGKDRAILEQAKNVQYSLDVLVSELEKFHNQVERKDAYLKEVLDKRDLRIDDLIEMIRIQNEAIISQNARIQERADRLMGVLESKM